MDRVVQVNGHELKLTNLDKVFWPRSGITKGDLLTYYDSISEYIIPHLAGRPESLNRFPDGINGENFYQKNTEGAPAWMQNYVDNDADKKGVNYIIANTRADLLYLVNLGCIDLNVWNSRVESPDKPDFMVFDLDPVETEYGQVIAVALEIKEIMDSLGIMPYAKTSGKRGLHIYVPTGARYTYDQVRDFAHLIVMQVNHFLPDTTSLERQPAKRRGKVYLDYLQNRRGATMAAPYSVRPVPEAYVSMPVGWEELRKGIAPADFTIDNAYARLKKRGDIFAGTLFSEFDLAEALAKFEKLYDSI